MKGEVFLAFNQMVEDQIGIACWETLLEKVEPDSQGIYTSVEAYPDSELFSLVGALSEEAKVPVAELVEQFGCYLFDTLNTKYPIFTQQQPDFFSFIESIDDVIHREVRKLYQTDNLPSLACQRIDEKTLEMTYQSPRKLCILAEGLIRGAAKHYGVEYTLAHEVCMHKGSDHCLFVIAIQ